MSDVTASAPSPATIPAPAPPAAPTTVVPVEAPPVRTATKLEKAANVLAQLAAERAAKTPPATAETAPAPAPETAKAESATPEKPAPDKTPKDDRDIRLAKAQEVSLRKDRDIIEARQRAEKLEAELKARDERLQSIETELGGKDAKALVEIASAFEAKDHKKAYQLMRKHGMSMEDLAKAVVDEPDEPPEDPKEAALKALQADIERLKAEKAAEIEAAKAEKERIEQERQAELARAESERVFNDNVTRVTSMLTEQAEAYPALASFKRAPAEVVRRWNAHIEQHGEAPKIEELLGNFNKQVFDDLTEITASEHALKAFLTRPEIQNRALSILGVKQETATSPASTQGDNGQRKGAPTAIPQTAAADAGSRKSRPRTQDEKLRAALASLNLK